jgi:hypothetical protein
VFCVIGSIQPTPSAGEPSSVASGLRLADALYTLILIQLFPESIVRKSEKAVSLEPTCTIAKPVVRLVNTT